MMKKWKSSCIYIPVKTNLIYEKHIHHLMVLCLCGMKTYGMLEFYMYSSEAEYRNQEKKETRFVVLKATLSMKWKDA